MGTVMQGSSISLLTYLFLFFPVVAAAQSSGPIAHWTFDEGVGSLAGASAGNGNDGQLSGGPAWMPGVIDGALLFDGIDDVVMIDDSGPNSSLDIDTNQLTIALWINPAVNNTDNDKPVSKDNVYEFQIGNAGPGRWHLRLNNASGSLTEWAQTPL